MLFVYSRGMRVLAFIIIIIIILIYYFSLCMCVCERKYACPMVISVCYCVASIFFQLGHAGKRTYCFGIRFVKLENRKKSLIDAYLIIHCKQILKILISGTHHGLLTVIQLHN